MAMKAIKHFVLWLFILSSSFSIIAQENNSAEINSLLTEANRIGVFSGSALVAVKDKIIYQKAIGYRDGAKTQNLATELRFDIGSIAKEFNGVAVMMLEQQSRANLDDPLSRYFPELPEWANKVRIKHLLNYTGGLPNTTAAADEDVRKELLGLKKLEFKPGTGYIYSYNNVYLQRRIVEKISGLSYKQFVESKIFRPCKMTNAVVDNPIDDPQAARAFDNNFVESVATQNISGGVMLTAEDLYQWTKCLHSGSLIDEESLKTLSDSFPGGESSLGSAKYENGKLVRHQHQGSNFNFEGLLSVDVNSGVTVILLTNNQNLKVFPLRDAIAAILAGKPYAVPKKSIYLDLREKLVADFEAGIAFYNRIKESKDEKYDWASEFYDLISTGKYLQRRARYDDAIKIFQLASMFGMKKSDISYSFELIGDSYLKKGSRQMAILYYIKALEKDAGNKNASGRLAEIRKIVQPVESEK